MFTDISLLKWNLRKQLKCFRTCEKQRLANQNSNERFVNETEGLTRFTDCKHHFELKCMRFYRLPEKMPDF